MVVDVTTGETFEPRGSPRVLFPDQYVLGSTNWDISSDGQQFLMMRPSLPVDGSPAWQDLTVVLNWFEELKRLVPVD